MNDRTGPLSDPSHQSVANTTALQSPVSTLSSMPLSLASRLTLAASSAISTDSRLKTKASAEYRALRQQLFRVQHDLNTCRLDLERERVEREEERLRLEDQLREVQADLSEAERDRDFMFAAEQQAQKEARETSETAKALRSKLEAALSETRQKLEAERETRHVTAEACTLLELELRTLTSNKSSALSAASVDSSTRALADELAAAKIREAELEQQLAVQQERLDAQATQTNAEVDHVRLRRMLLAQFTEHVDLATENKRLRAESERLASRIGSVRVLEERLRETQIRLKRLEAAEDASLRHNASLVPQPAPASPPVDGCPPDALLRLIQMTESAGVLRQQLAEAQVQLVSLAADQHATSTKLTEQTTLLQQTQQQLRETQVAMAARDATIKSLRDQLTAATRLLPQPSQH